MLTCDDRVGVDGWMGGGGVNRPSNEKHKVTATNAGN